MFYTLDLFTPHPYTSLKGKFCVLFGNRMNKKNNRRSAKPISDKKLYKLPKSSINEFIEKERRHDELDRLREVQEQKKVWLKIFLACLSMNLIFIAFAIVGALYNG